jgi:hypothetical protein
MGISVVAASMFRVVRHDGSRRGATIRAELFRTDGVRKAFGRWPLTVLIGLAGTGWRSIGHTATPRGRRFKARTPIPGLMAVFGRTQR